jgi:hypothetical protein
MDESLLDFFAGMALSGLVARSPSGVPAETLAHEAYWRAEVMMQIREERNNASKTVKRPKR